MRRAAAAALAALALAPASAGAHHGGETGRCPHHGSAVDRQVMLAHRAMLDRHAGDVAGVYHHSDRCRRVGRRSFDYTLVIAFDEWGDRTRRVRIRATRRSWRELPLLAPCGKLYRNGSRCDR